MRSRTRPPRRSRGLAATLEPCRRWRTASEESSLRAWRGFDPLGDDRVEAGEEGAEGGGLGRGDLSGGEFGLEPRRPLVAVLPVPQRPPSVRARPLAVFRQERPSAAR